MKPCIDRSFIYVNYPGELGFFAQVLKSKDEFIFVYKASKNGKALNKVNRVIRVNQNECKITILNKKH